ncbi:MAG TPA: ferrous iron transport protein B [Syntrophales bacterium]|mgnify:CR=1 FL=1|nr:ferrous iron transport protein B [Syntrophales bacterium]
MNRETVPLLVLKEGDEGYIQTISGGTALTARLAAMGLAPSLRVRILQKSGGLIMLQAGDTRVALGRGEAEKILVVRFQPDDIEAQCRECRQLLVALAGQPNVGKSTVFNILTGLSQHVGNWPGKTVEKKEGSYVTEGVELRIVDLPGTYSLTAFSEEERVAREFIIHSRPDVTVLLVNAAALERSLYLLSELLLLETPVIVGLNMLDVADSQGISVDAAALQRFLGIPVVSMVATKNTGIRELVSRVIAVADRTEDYRPRLPDVLADHREIYDRLEELVRDIVQPPYGTRWVSIKLMEGDTEICRMIEDAAAPGAWTEIQSLLIKHEDSLHAVVGGRYDWIEEAKRASVSRFEMEQVVVTDRIDHVLTRPLFGIPVLLLMFAAVFVLTYRVGFPLQRGLEYLISSFASWLDPLLGAFPPWIRGVILDGMIGGAGSVLTFVPVLVIFFAVMALLEDVGYMARAAFVMDRFMHLVGLHGKSFIPMCLGFGCNVAAVMGARIVESKKERLLTIFLSPFVPCTARLTVLVFVSAAVFGEYGGLVAWALLAANILALGAAGIAVNRLFLKDEPMPFVMELPLYHKPDPRTIGAVVWTRTLSFLRKAGTIILGVSVAVWILAYFPDGKVETSILAWFGRFLEPLGSPLGLDWKVLTALLTSIVAKENVVATLGVLYGVGDEGLVRVLPTVLSRASALSLLTVLMLFVPCAATAAAMKSEMGSRAWFYGATAATFAVSLCGGFVAYRLALLFGI